MLEIAYEGYDEPLSFSTTDSEGHSYSVDYARSGSAGPITSAIVTRDGQPFVISEYAWTEDSGVWYLQRYRARTYYEGQQVFELQASLEPDGGGIGDAGMMNRVFADAARVGSLFTPAEAWAADDCSDQLGAFGVASLNLAYRMTKAYVVRTWGNIIDAYIGLTAWSVTGRAYYNCRRRQEI